MTLVFMIASLNRLPLSTMKPASSFNGLSIGVMTSGSSEWILAQFSPIVLPLTVSAFSWMSLRFISSLTTAGTPPAR